MKYKYFLTFLVACLLFMTGSVFASTKKAICSDNDVKGTAYYYENDETDSGFDIVKKSSSSSNQEIVIMPEGESQPTADEKECKNGVIKTYYFLLLKAVSTPSGNCPSETGGICTEDGNYGNISGITDTSWGNNIVVDNESSVNSDSHWTLDYYLEKYKSIDNESLQRIDGNNIYVRHFSWVSLDGIQGNGNVDISKIDSEDFKKAFVKATVFPIISTLKDNTLTLTISRKFEGNESAEPYNNGKKWYFHPYVYSIKTCKGNESRYCGVSCKDNVDFELPNKKKAYVGSYYSLNLGKSESEKNIGPTIKYQRTCVTTEIDIDQFKNDVTAASSKLPLLFGIYKNSPTPVNLYEYKNAYNNYKDIVDEINMCYTWAGNDILFPNDDSPKIKYIYDDNTIVAGDMKANLLSDEKNSNYSNNSNYIPSHLFPSTTYDGTNCPENPNEGSQSHCNIQNITLSGGDKYVRKIQTKKWEYKTIKEIWGTKDGKLVEESSIDKTKIKLSGINATPINLSSEAKVNNEYSLKFSNLDDSFREKYTRDNEDLLNKMKKSRIFTNEDSYKCKYDTINDLVKEKDNNFFFRTINVGNINPNNRNLGYNWNSSADTIKDYIKQTDNYQVLTGEEEKSSVTTADKTSDAITFTLTPSLMKDIRENYNKDEDFSSNNSLTCTDTNSFIKHYCQSAFLNCLATGNNCSNYIKDSNLINGVTTNEKLLDFRKKMQIKNNNYIE